MDACRRIGAADYEEFRKRLLGEAGVAVLADIHFGSRVPGEGQHVRFSYAAAKSAIEAGGQRMAGFIRENTRKAAWSGGRASPWPRGSSGAGAFFSSRSASTARWC